MILKIRARNIGIIEQVDVDLKPGLNVITGETGAGKTLFTRALLACFGFQPLTGLQADPGNETFVEVVIDNPDSETQYSVIRRELKGGRTFSYLDDKIASNEKLVNFAEHRIAVLAQHSSISLLKKEKQRMLVDSLNDDTRQAFESYRQSYEHLKKLKGEYEKLKVKREEYLRQREILTYQLKELVSADLKENEDVELEEYVAKIRNRAKIAEAVYHAVELLKQSDESALEKISKACAEVGKIQSFESKAGEILQRLYEVQSQLEDLVLEIKSAFAVEDVSVEELEAAESRLFMIQELKRKYGRDLDGLIALRNELEETLSTAQSYEDMIKELEDSIRNTERKLAELAEKLSVKRKEAANLIEASVNRLLSELNMGNTEFRVLLNPVSAGGPFGSEEIVFQIRNKGGNFSPIDAAISGGELSRLLLALESSINDTLDVFVFDEVDAGIGGDTALQVGKYLKKLAERAQVIVVTHLPQIAAFASNHISVTKEETGGRTVAMFSTLNEAGVVKEIARMLSGSAVKDKAEEHARNLIQYARGA